jgi:hypothetical protein
LFKSASKLIWYWDLGRHIANIIVAYARNDKVLRTNDSSLTTTKVS